MGKFLFELQPDCTVYAKGRIKDKVKDRLNLSLADSLIEVKKKSADDPFAHKTSDSMEEDNSFVTSEGRALHTLGQLTVYATALLGSQYRTHAFMTFITGTYARLIRWDRSGAVVTEPIYFNTQPHLFDFFTRYNIAGHEARGNDATVTVPTDEEITLAKSIVPELKDLVSFLAIATPDSTNHSDRRFIVRHPEPSPDIPVGHWTRALFALDVKNKDRVFLKDSWHVSVKDVQPEGEIYRLLCTEQVLNVPICLLAVNVSDDFVHQSRTDEVKNKHFRDHICWKLTPHQHYHIVLGTIGRELKDFHCTKEFVNAMSAALRGEIPFS